MPHCEMRLGQRRSSPNIGLFILHSRAKWLEGRVLPLVPTKDKAHPADRESFPLAAILLDYTKTVIKQFEFSNHQLPTCH